MDTIKMIEQCIRFIQENTLVPCSIDRSIDPSVEPDHYYSMWDGIALNEGYLYVNPDIANAGDLLHEAGHLVTIPSKLRALINGDLGSNPEFLKSLCEYGATFDPVRSFSDDDAATYWGVCALQTMKLDIKTMFENGYTTEFRSEQKDQEIASYVEIARQSRSRFSVAAHYAGLLDSNPRANLNGNPMIDRWDIGLS
jgi:hypothetical protein